MNIESIPVTLDHIENAKSRPITRCALSLAIGDVYPSYIMPRPIIIGADYTRLITRKTNKTFKHSEKLSNWISRFEKYAMRSRGGIKNEQDAIKYRPEPFTLTINHDTKEMKVKGEHDTPCKNLNLKVSREQK